MSHTLSALGLPIKRWLDDVCWHALAADFDLDGGAEFRKACRHIAQPDALLEKRREISAGDIANGIRGRGVEDSESVARHGFLDEFEGNESTSNSGLFLRQEHLAADRAVTGVMELESFKCRSAKTHEQLARFGTLNGDLRQFD